jgi:hypothetical protein
MRPEFRRALDAARQHDDPSSRISVIKRAVTTEVTAMDPTVRVRFTDYFNHSIAPDIVLQWPNENRERLLFVRPTGRASWLLNEIRFVSPHRPLVFTLEDLGAPDGNGASIARESLEEVAAAAGTWITDSSGTEAMSSVRKRNPTLGLLSQALVRGGRGVSDGEGIAQLINDTEAGFAGASHLSVAATRSAVEAIESHLDVNQSGRLTRLLRAVWEGHGGDSANFPRTSTLGTLTEDDLSYLLETTSEGSADFWRRIGRAIDTEMLGRTQVSDPSPNLQALISGSLEALQAKGVRLIYEPLRLGESEDTPRWLVARGCLALRGLNWTAYVAARLTEEFPPADQAQVPDLSTLRRRAKENQVPITQIRLRKGDRVVTYESKEGGNVLGHPGLSKAAADLEVTDIDGAVAKLPGGGNVGIDFPQKTAVGPTNAMFPLGPLMRTTLSLLSDFSPEEGAELRLALEGEGYQPALFPEQPAPTED